MNKSGAGGETQGGRLGGCDEAHGGGQILGSFPTLLPSWCLVLPSTLKSPKRCQVLTPNLLTTHTHKNKLKNISYPHVTVAELRLKLTLKHHRFLPYCIPLKGLLGLSKMPLHAVFAGVHTK